MKKAAKPTFFIVLALILALTYCAFFGVYDYYGDTKNTYIKGAQDIRWGIDIRGGVEAVFTPDVEVNSISDEDMDAAKEIIETRLVNNNITDYEVYTDTANHQVIVRFPWKADESDFDATSAVAELGETAMLTFCEGQTQDTVILKGAEHIKSAKPAVQENAYVVQLELTDAGSTLFADATTRLQKQVISIWMDDVMISAPTVETPITNGIAVITGVGDAEEATDLANKINAGSLPFALSVDDSKLQIVTHKFRKSFV